jgi:pyruvate,water dikinase
MMNDSYILTLSAPQADLAKAGGKGAALARLAMAGLAVPAGFHVITDTYKQFVAQNELRPFIMDALQNIDISRPDSLQRASQTIQDAFMQANMPSDIASAIAHAYASLAGDNTPVAVRSSATAEDLPHLSFAGQQETFLTISGAAAVQEAVQRCWASLWTARAINYRWQHGIDQEPLSMAVVVQLMVDAEASGVLFTVDPISGQRDQALISAAWGLGEAIVGGQVTPDTLCMDKESGRVLVRQTADKAVMTVRRAGGTKEVAVPSKRRRAAVLSDEQAGELLQLGLQIENLFGKPMDIEWTWDGRQFAIVQARPITALPLPEPPPPAEWPLPPGKRIAMRNNIVELMADPLSPLFRTLGLAAVNKSLGSLLASFLGSREVMPDDLIFTVNEYAYYNGSVKVWPMLKIIFDSVGIMRRMFSGAVERWIEHGRPQYSACVEAWRRRPWRELPAVDILEGARELSEAAIAAYGSLVSGVIPAAWMSEGLFTLTYKLVKRRDDPPAPVFLMGFDSLPIRAEKSLYDLAQWAGDNDGLAAYLRDTPAQQLVGQLSEPQAPAGIAGSIWHEWQTRFRQHLRTYGHTIYNLDFANPVPADDPAPLLDTLKLFFSDEGVDPHVRQQETAARREEAAQMLFARLRGIRLKLFSKSLAQAQRYAPLREDGLADVGLGYPLLRQMLLEIGRRFAAAGAIEQLEDIFWLTGEEVEQAAAQLDQQEPLADLAASIPVRKAAWRAAKRVAPPLMLPRLKFFGVDMMQLKAGRGQKAADSLKGVPASPGTVTARACVVHGPEEFGSMQAGDILVAPLTTPAWTPLFVRAAAIVTDVGGPLSHGSIVAREYGIPAVLGTGSATRRIRSGQVITVDGSTGKVYLQNGR